MRITTPPRFTRIGAALALVLSITAAPAQAQTPMVGQGASVIVHGSGICTVGFNEPARRRSFVAAHCGAEGSRVELYNPRTGARSGPVGTLYRSKRYDSHLGNDWAAIQWDPSVHIGANHITGNAWVHPNDIRIGERVCYFGQTSHLGGGETCGRFAGSADNTFFIDAPLTRPGDSGGPMWVPGRGFVGVTSAKWRSLPIPGVKPRDFVVGMVPRDGAAVPEIRLVGLWAQNTFLPGLTGPVAEVIRQAVDAILRVLSGIGLAGPTVVNYG